jgi:tyrosyl-tRNA synthetase
MESFELFGLTQPLITTASGAKMGKTAHGAVWLNADMKSPYEYWQYWRNTEDADVGRFLRLFTDLPVADIEKLEALEGAQINDAKIALANLTAALEMSGLAASKGEAKRKIAEGAVRVNDAVVEDANAVLKSANLTDQQLIKLSLGKKRHALLRVGN